MVTRINIIYTGGTIGGKYVRRQQILADDVKLSVFQKFVARALPPDLGQYVELSFSPPPINKFSEEMVPADWEKIGASVAQAVELGVDGVVIAHGTDTLAYTAAALSFILRGVPIPVVVTGSNSPLSDEHSDGARNLADAIRVASDRQFRGVYVVFSGVKDKASVIHLGTRVRKARFIGNCYESVNVFPIGEVRAAGWLWWRRPGISIWNGKLVSHVASKLATDGKFRVEGHFNPQVSCYKLYPGFDPETINNDIKRGKVAIIVEAFNSGTGCTEKSAYSLLRAMEIADATYVPVFFCSQHEGSVDMDLYESAVALREAGAVPLGDMIMEAAVPKVMWALHQTEGIRDRVQRRKAIIELVLRDICGEISSKAP